MATENVGYIEFDKMHLSDQQDFYCAGYSEQFLRNFRQLFNDQVLCDVTLISGIGKRKILAHRIVLASASEYFRAMLTGLFGESSEKEINLEFIDGDTIELILNYIYSGNAILQSTNIEGVLFASSLMQLDDLFEECCEFLADQLDPSNCLAMESFAEHYSCKALANRCYLYACKHFMEVSKHDDFLDISAERFVKMLKCDDLNVSSEEDVFHAVISWMHQDMNERVTFLREILSFVRLPLLRPDFMFDYVATLSKLPGCDDLLREAYKWQMLPERRTEIDSQRTKPRKSTTGRLIAIGQGDGVFVVERFCPILDKWSLVSSAKNRSPCFRPRFSTIIFQNALIVLGGIHSASVDRLDFSTNIWCSMPSMNSARDTAGVAVLNGLLYAIGGFDGNKYLETVERYDPSTQTWSNVASMSQERFSAGIVVLNGRLYAVGGRKTSCCLSTVECYDPETNSWVFRAEMNGKQCGTSIAVMNNCIYALGGHDGQLFISSVERYDSVTNVWTTIASLSTTRHFIGVAINGENILAIGGFAENKYIDFIEKYDAEQNKWVKLNTLNFSTLGMNISHLMPNIIVISIPSHTDKI